MDFKKIGVALLILIVLGAGFGWWASRQAAPAQQNNRILAGEQIGEGELYRYAEEGQYHTIEAFYPGDRPIVEAAVAARIAEFKQNAQLDSLTPEDIEIQGLGGERKYALGLEYKVYTGAGYTSYVYTVYEDALGAHPNTYFMTFVFDAQGNQKTLGQILSKNPNALEELSLLVSNDVVAQYKARAQVDDATGLIYDEGLVATEENYRNFYVDGSDVVVLFPPYQIAAYALGSFESRVPLAEISK